MCQSNNEGFLRVILLIALTISTFVICWTPLHIYNLSKFSGKKMMSENACIYLGKTFYGLIFINDAINPIIYSFMGTKFRKIFFIYISISKYTYEYSHKGPTRSRQWNYYQTRSNISFKI